MKKLFVFTTATSFKAPIARHMIDWRVAIGQILRSFARDIGTKLSLEGFRLNCNADRLITLHGVSGLDIAIVQLDALAFDGCEVSWD
jgi:hypothetical protein